MHKYLFIFLFSIYLSGCSNSSPPSIPADIKTKKVVEQFKPLKNNANIYMRLKKGRILGIGGTVKSDNYVIGELKSGEYINFKAEPGNYSFNIDTKATTNGKTKISLAKFDLNVNAKALVLIECEPAGGGFTIKRKSGPVLQPLSKCGINNLTKLNGLTACITPFKNTKVSSEDWGKEPWSSCSITNDIKSFKNSSLVKTNVSMITSPDSEYRRARKINTAKAYQSFLSANPNYKKRSSVVNTINKLKASEKSQAKRNKLNKKIQRDSKLPLSVRKDKYMIVLTGHLKRQEFKESLEYFELLEGLNTNLSPSFNFFWGEALVRTNQPKLAIEKLHSYIKNTGSQGKYYTKALELINDAEKKL